MDPDAITAYPRHHSFSYSPRRQPSRERQAGGLGRFQYSSDPTLLDDKDDGEESWVSQESGQGGRRSAMSMSEYTRSEESENVAREARKAKKRKLRHLRSFVHVFLGGLRRKPNADSGEGGEREADVESTRNKQRDERNSLARAVANGSRHPGEAEEGRRERTRRGSNDYQGVPSPRHGLPRLPQPLEVPGLYGLYNHGNTCFMNAVLQCLSNTDRLAAFFVTDAFKGDLNKNKSLRHFGTSGNVTQQFALLLKCLWSGQYNPVVSARFKETVGRYAEQYQGTAQHDAQEFFLWLLDNIHEDLNQAGKKRYRPLRDTVGRPDEEVAAEALASHLQLNNSFIQNLFQGQFRSALICPSCAIRSCTFDPYVCISLPLPQRETKPVYVTVVYRGAGRKMRVFGVNVSINGSIRELRNKLAELCGVHRHHLVLSDLLPDGFHRTFYDDQHISVIHTNDLVFAFECPPYRGDNPEAHTHTNPSGSKELILVLVVNKIGTTQFGKRFGQPLILRIWRDLTHFQFQSVVLKHMVKYLREGLKLAEVCRRGVLFNCRVIDGLPGRSILPTDADHPFYSPSVDKLSYQIGFSRNKLGTRVKFPITGLDMTPFLAPRSTTSSRPSSATPISHQKVPRTPAKSVHFEDEVHESKKPPLSRSISAGRGKGKKFLFPWKRQHSEPYKKEVGERGGRGEERGGGERRGERGGGGKERGGGGKERGGGKKGGRSAELSSSRRQQHNLKPHSQERRSKSPDPPRRAYSPPPSPLSIRSAPSTIERHEFPPQPSLRHFRPPSPLHHLSSSQTSLEETRLDNVYDLYAICNHSGSLTRGHYTAFCKNPVDGRWYNYDDTTVQPVSEDHLVTSQAYLLFYVRQSLLSPSPLSSSESSQSSSGSSHWLYHMPPFRLDLADYKEELAQLQRQSSPSEGQPDFAGEAKSRSRLDSTNSILSAPPNYGSSAASSRVSPPSSAVDVDSVISPESGSMINGHVSLSGHENRSDARSVASLPPYRIPGRQFSNGTPRSYPVPPPYNHAVAYSSRGPSARHDSLRLGRVGDRQAMDDTDGALRRGYSFQSRHQDVHKSHSNTTFQAYDGMRPRHFQGPVLPTRSIPNFPTQEEIAMTPNRYSQEPFMTPQLNNKNSASNGHIAINIGTRFTAPSLAHNHPESCV